MTIAVLIPAYNVEKYIADCLDSVLVQTYPDFEVYVMNDGSTDKTLEILKTYPKKDKRIHIYSQENQGVTKTRNILLDKLKQKTDYLFYLDADDFIHSKTFEYLMRYMNKYHPDVVECGLQFVPDETHPEDFSKIIVSQKKMKFIQDMDIFWSNKTRLGWINVVNKLYRWSAIKDIRFSEKLAFEDDFFYSSLINAQIKSKILIPENLYFYRMNPTSATHQIDYTKYLSCAINRIQLSYDTFLKTNRVPLKYESDFRVDLAKDAYRMIVRKNLKKNKNIQQCRQLFYLSAQTIRDFKNQKVVDFSTLSFLKKIALWACGHQYFYLTKILVYLAG